MANNSHIHSMEKQMRRPEPQESDGYYTTYISKVEGDDFLKVLTKSFHETLALLEGLSKEQWEYRYEDGKWDIKEVMMHILDAERIFTYRALRIARNDKTPLAGFNQDDYIPYTDASDRTPASIIDEYKAVRMATIALFEHLTDEMYTRMGTASGLPFSPLALGFITAGHEIHHVRILKERYLAGR